MSPETAIIETDLDRLSRRESRAHECLDNSVKSWIAFIDELNAIQADGDWKVKAETWQAYIAAEFLPKLNFGYERIYQLKAAQPFAKSIEQSTGITLNERNTRLVKSLGYNDPLAPATTDLIIRADSAAKLTGTRIAPKHIKAAHEHTQDASYHGKVSLEGEDIPLGIPLDPIQLAVVDTAMESVHRGAEIIRSKSKRERKSATIESILSGGVVLALELEVFWYEDIVESDAA